jgi:hypothetical protein
VEKTPKPLKALQLVGVVLLLFGVAVRTGTGEFYGTWLAFIGLLMYAVGRIGAWWRNG